MMVYLFLLPPLHLNMQLREHPEALEELREATFWYDDKEVGLGECLYDAANLVTGTHAWTNHTGHRASTLRISL